MVFNLVDKSLTIFATAPAETSISYVAKSFDRGFQNAMPIYEQEPSEEVDRAWRELTRCS